VSDIYITEQPPAPPPVKWRLVLEKEEIASQWQQNPGLGLSALVGGVKPITRPATPKDIAAVVDGLMSDDARIVLTAVIARLNPMRTLDHLLATTTGDAHLQLLDHIRKTVPVSGGG
jgi:hypothetical protein